VSPWWRRGDFQQGEFCLPCFAGYSLSQAAGGGDSAEPAVDQVEVGDGSGDFGGGAGIGVQQLRGGAALHCWILADAGLAACQWALTKGFHCSGSCGKLGTVKLLRYIELKSGHSDNGPAWIGYVTSSKTGRTLYFNGRGLMKLKDQRRAESGGNYVDMETGESFGVSGVKKNGEDRHWAGSGKVLIEPAAVSEYLETIGAKTLDRSRCEVTSSIRQTDITRLSKLANATYKGWSDEGDESQFTRNVASRSN